MWTHPYWTGVTRISDKLPKHKIKQRFLYSESLLRRYLWFNNNSAITARHQLLPNLHTYLFPPKIILSLHVSIKTNHWFVSSWNFLRFILAIFLYKLLNNALVTCKYTSQQHVKHVLKIYMIYKFFSEILIRGNVGKVYDYLCDLCFDCKEALTFPNLENFD